MLKKISILTSILLCIVFFQNCGDAGFEPQYTNKSSEINNFDEIRNADLPSNDPTPEPKPNNLLPKEPVVSAPMPELTPEAPEVNLKFSNLKATLNKDNQVVITWNQSHPGTGQVFFGLFKNDINKKTDKEEKNLTFHRKVIREELSANKKYYFRVTSVANNKAFSSSYISLIYEPIVQREPTNAPSIAEGDIATYCDETKPLCGIMYGVAIAGESYGHTAKYKNAASIRFQAEKTGFVKYYSYHNRVFRTPEWTRDNGKGYNSRFQCQNTDLTCKLKKFKTGGYHTGNGGLLSFTINEDDGNGNPKNKPLAKGKSKLVPTKNKNYVGTYEGMKYYTGDNTYDKIEWEEPVKLDLGKYYHLVMHQEQPEKGTVVLNGFYAHHPSTKTGSAPGGPYYGRRFSAMTRQTPNGAWKVRLNVFPDFKLHYTDGTIAGPGNEGVGGEYSRYTVQGQKMIRQVFTMDYNSEFTGIWARVNRLNGNSPLTITVKEASGRVLSKILSPSSKIPNTYETAVKGPVNWIYNKFTSPISFIKGRKYYVEFQSQNSTAYQIQTEETYDYDNGKKLSKESVWSGSEDRAEFSTTGANGFKRVPRSVKDLPILFTINGKPEVVN